MLERRPHFGDTPIIGLADDDNISCKLNDVTSDSRMRKLGNMMLSGSFSFQNSSLYINTLFLAAKEFGWITSGHEHGAIFGAIMAGGGLLFMANGKAYYVLLEDFARQRSGPALSLKNMTWTDIAKKGLGLYCSTAKVVATGVSTFILWDGITERLGAHRELAAAITAVTGIGNFACNMSIFLRPKQTLRSEQLMRHRYFKCVLGEDSLRLTQILQKSDRLEEQKTQLSLAQWILSHLFTALYALQNGLLYQDAYFSFAKQLGVVTMGAMVAGTVGSVYFWLFMGLVGVPICVGNYLSYLPLIKEYFRASNLPQEQEETVISKDWRETAWDGVAVGGASMKFLGTAFSTAKVGLQMTPDRSAEYIAAVISLDLVLSSATYVANKAIFSRDTTSGLSKFGTFRSEIDVLVNSADKTRVSVEGDVVLAPRGYVSV